MKREMLDADLDFDPTYRVQRFFASALLGAAINLARRCDMADRIARMLNDEFARFKKIATEAAAGIA